MAKELTVAGVPLTDAKELEKALVAYSDARKVLLAWIAAELTPGIDYMVIHRKFRGQPCKNEKDVRTTPCESCGSKATLLKPGSEKICGLMRVVPVFTKDTDTWSMLSQADRDAGTICYVCHLHQHTADGPVLAEGRGARTTAQDGGVANTSIKMTEKSGQIDATLRLGGLSDAYTQDLEDLKLNGEKEERKSAFGEPPEKPMEETAKLTPHGKATLAAATNASIENDAVVAMRPEGAISENQVRLLYAKLRAISDGTEEDFQANKEKLKFHLSRECGVEHIEWIVEKAHFEWAKKLLEQQEKRVAAAKQQSFKDVRRKK